jgi:RHS repeat-associated protein
LTNATPVGTQTYDDNGNLIYAENIYHGYSYDDENRLANWYYYVDGINGEGSPTSSEDLRSEFIYDGLGRLRKRVDYQATDYPHTWYSIIEFYYIYDGMRLIQERNGSLPWVSYTRGSDLSGTLEGVGGIGGMLARSHGYASSNGNWYVHNSYHADGGGNITYMVDSSQGLAASYKYDAYGNLSGYSGPIAIYNRYRFSSKEIHTVGGIDLYYYGYRWYHPNLQRWLNRDPLGELGFELLRNETPDVSGSGPNFYLFVENDPVVSFDAIGLARQKGQYGTGFAAWYRCMSDCKEAVRACYMVAALEGIVVGGMVRRIPMFGRICGAGVGGYMIATCMRVQTACEEACNKKTNYTPKPGTPRP